MEADLQVFLDTSVLFAAVHSETGGSRLILKLGEASAISIWVGPTVLRESESVLSRKSPQSKVYFALWLDRAGVQVGEEAGNEAIDKALTIVRYVPDAQVLAEALTISVDYFVSLDRKHLVGNPLADQKLTFPIGTPGDFIDWYRKWLKGKF